MAYYPSALDHGEYEELELKNDIRPTASALPSAAKVKLYIRHVGRIAQEKIEQRARVRCPK